MINDTMRNKAICTAQTAIINRMGETKEAYTVVRLMIDEVKSAKGLIELKRIVEKYS